MFQFLKKNRDQSVFQISENGAPAKADTVRPEDEYSPLSKLKILVAVMVVGFGVYAAYWAQEPVSSVSGQLKADVVSEDENATPSGENQIIQAETTAEEVDTLKISIANFQFDPSSLKIEKGQTVEWTNNDTVPHTVTADTFTSETLNPGESFSYTFETDGKFEYHCSFHPQMLAEVLVGDLPVAAENVLVLKPAAEEVSLNPLPTSDIPADLKPAAVDYTFLDEADSANGQSQLLAATDENAKVEPLSTTTGKIIRSTRIPDSGPEHLLYVAILGGILYLNRRKLFHSFNS